MRKRDFKFDKRAASYDDGFEGRWSARFYNLLLSRVELEPGAAVLDVGCGTGTILKRLGERDRICGCGIDVEEKMVAEAKLKCPDMDISVSDCSSTSFESEQFDVVVTCMAYHHFDDKKGFAKEAARLLKTGGYLYITDPRFPALIRKPLHLAFRIHRIAAHFGTAKEMANEFSEYGFEFVDAAFDKYAQCVKLKKTAWAATKKRPVLPKEGTRGRRGIGSAVH